LNIKILSTALLEMEMDGVISLLPGGRYSLEL
jgi:predicted Rossmann fold nucleotide-binding protein DprA/Smf involved in DNA uptake